MDIVIFGSGNVAWSLGHAFLQSGQKVLQVVSRNKHTGLKLAKELSSDFVLFSENEFHYTKDTICILTFPDDILRKIGDSLSIKNSIVVHTAGSVPKDVLINISEKIGVFYPLQTLRIGMHVEKNYPLLIDASDSVILETLHNLAHKISDIVVEADDAKREKMHLAAVVVNNFVNHMYTLTYDYCKDQDIDFQIFIPLIQETVHRIESNPPQTVQTGPAMRNDQKTIDRHIKMLQDYPWLLNTYANISESLMMYYKNNNRR